MSLQFCENIKDTSYVTRSGFSHKFLLKQGYQSNYGALLFISLVKKIINWQDRGLKLSTFSDMDNLTF